MVRILGARNLTDWMSECVAFLFSLFILLLLFMFYNIFKKLFKILMTFFMHLLANVFMLLRPDKSDQKRALHFVIF